ncbi:DNA gyrase inhibitor YacG [uncultured Xylophilus sp.]|uniref:DNA gyrase inhibitor YacG n=1 Tax=uncultured Xylophilus sp. TaxID=296832 RepID=UPI0025E8A7D0|nr:DNA gyrase inhibitor YacG [uncultured Xylophilus sp.]
MSAGSDPRGDAPPPLTPRTVACPACGGDSVYSLDNPHRPFCSARCRGIDFGQWASEEFRVPTEGPPDDEPFGDPRHQH